MTCCANVHVRGMNFYRTRVCGCKASVKRKGKYYCKRHDPVARAKKQKASDKKRTDAMHKKLKIQIYLRYGKLFGKDEK